MATPLWSKCSRCRRVFPEAAGWHLPRLPVCSDCIARDAVWLYRALAVVALSIVAGGAWLVCAGMQQ